MTRIKYNNLLTVKIIRVLEEGIINDFIKRIYIFVLVLWLFKFVIAATPSTPSCTFKLLNAVNFRQQQSYG